MLLNTLEAVNSRITEAEDRISELEDRMVEINETGNKTKSSTKLGHKCMPLHSISFERLPINFPLKRVWQFPINLHVVHKHKHTY